MTANELFSLRENDRIDRRLIGGRLVERPYPFRSPAHGAVVANLCGLLGNWADSVGGTDWVIYGYGCPFRLRRDPDTLVYFDASVIPRALDISSPKLAQFIDGRPTLAIEVIDKSDSKDAIIELVDSAMVAGIPLLWLVNPLEEYVEVHRPGCGSVILDRGDDLVATFVGPTICFPVTALFE